MKTYHIVKTDYHYFVAVETYSLKGREPIHTFEAKDFLEAVDYKNSYVKEHNLKC